MKNRKTTSLSLLVAPLALALAVLILGSDARWHEPVAQPESASYIVQGSSAEDVKALVQRAGGVVTHELGIIRGVAAQLTPDQLLALEELDAVHRISRHDPAR